MMNMQNDDYNQLPLNKYCESMVLMTDVLNPMISTLNLKTVLVVMACHRVVVGPFW